MEFKKGTTDRGFSIITFEDLHQETCSIQKSSLATDDAIWLGIANKSIKIPAYMFNQICPGYTKEKTSWIELPADDIRLSDRMHLNREQVAQLIPILQRFVDIGEII